MKDYLTSSKAALFTYANSKLTSMGKLRIAGRNHSRVPTHVLRDSQIQGKPPLLSGSDRVKLGMVKFRADETHSVESSLGPATVQKPHPEASAQLPTAKNSHPRDMPRHPEPISSLRMFEVPHPNPTLPTRPAMLTLEWVLEAFSDVHTGWVSLESLFPLI